MMNRAKLESLKRKADKREKASQQMVIIDTIRAAAQKKKNGEEAIKTILHLIDKRMTIKEKQACYDALIDLIVNDQLLMVKRDD